MKYFMIFFLVFLLAVIMMPMVLLAQDGGAGFEWDQLGVDVVVVGVIISIVQVLKGVFPPKTIAWLPLILSMVLSAGYGILTNHGSIGFIIKMAFTYAAAAAWMYEVAKSVGIKALKGKTQVDAKKG